VVIGYHVVLLLRDVTKGHRGAGQT